MKEVDMVNPCTQKPSLHWTLSLSPNSKPTTMFLSHCHVPHHTMPTLSPFNSKPLSSSLPNPSFLTHHHPYPLTTTTHLNNNKPLSLSTIPRKFLCKPPQGKYIRDDYLVVCHFKHFTFYHILSGSILFFPPMPPMLLFLNFHVS